ncbi:MAG: hypothetical protein ACLQQ4_06280 [Bacteroidia bacterium]
MLKRKVFNKQPGRYEITYTVVLLILLVMVLLPLFILSFYNHATLEDYIETSVSLQKGFWGTQVWWYNSLQGRYIESLFQTLNPLVFNAYWAFKLNPVLLLSMLLIATCWLCHKLFKNLDTGSKLGICSLFIVSFIILMPQVFSGIFWQCGLIDCLLPDIMTLFLLGCIISYYQSANKKVYFILSCLLAILIIGSYDIHMLFVDFIIMLIAIINALNKRKSFFILTLLGICIIFSIISVSAPGNSHRLSCYPNAHNFYFSLKETLVWGINVLLRWHWLVLMVFTGILLFDFISKNEAWNEAVERIFIISPWLSLAACLIVPFISLFFCFWSQGKVPPQLNTLNGVYFYYVAGMMYFSFSAIVRIKKRHPDLRIPVFIKVPLYLVLVYMTFFRATNVTRAYKDITSGTASVYNLERIKIEETLMNTKGDSCIIDSIKNYPNSLPPLIYLGGLTNDDGMSGFSSTSCCQYYHKKYIGIRR